MGVQLNKAAGGWDVVPGSKANFLPNEPRRSGHCCGHSGAVCGPVIGQHQCLRSVGLGALGRVELHGRGASVDVRHPAMNAGCEHANHLGFPELVGVPS